VVHATQVLRTHRTAPVGKPDTQGGVVHNGEGDDTTGEASHTDRRAAAGDDLNGPSAAWGLQDPIVPDRCGRRSDLARSPSLAKSSWSSKAAAEHWVGGHLAHSFRKCRNRCCTYTVVDVAWAPAAFCLHVVVEVPAAHAAVAWAWVDLAQIVRSVPAMASGTRAVSGVSGRRTAADSPASMECVQHEDEDLDVAGARHSSG